MSQPDTLLERSLLARSGETYSVSSLLERPLHIRDLEFSLSESAEGLISYELNRVKADRELIKKGSFAARLNQITVNATLLDRPLALLSDVPINLEPRGAISVGLSRPLALEIVASHEGAGALSLCAAPLKVMRMTSYGLVNRAMLCYHWASPLTSTPLDGDEALVPIIINNQTRHPIELRKVVLYKSYLKLYQSAQGFITNLVKVQITSRQEAHIEYDDSPPTLGGSAASLVFESPDTTTPKLLKLLRLAGKRSAGVEYGF